MARGGTDDVELECGDIFSGGVGTYGTVGAQKGGPLQAGVWRGLSKEKVCHDTGDLVIFRLGRDCGFGLGICEMKMICI